MINATKAVKLSNMKAPSTNYGEEWRGGRVGEREEGREGKGETEGECEGFL